MTTKYALYGSRSIVKGLEYFEHIGIPFGGLLIQLLIVDRQMTPSKMLCVFLLMAQNVLVAVKIIYFGSITRELGQYLSIYAGSPCSPNCSGLLS